MTAIASGADDVNRPLASRVIEWHQCRRFKDRVKQTRKFFGRFTLSTKSDNESDELRWRRRTRQNICHRCSGMGRIKVVAIKQRRNQFWPTAY
jgi:hypothetical protein